MTQHTRGPWALGPWIRSGSYAVYRVVIGEGHRLASVLVYGHRKDGTSGGPTYVDEFGQKRLKAIRSEEQADADAALIAAAPDLLAAAEAMELVVRDHEIQGELSTLERAAAESLRAAIARAKGEEEVNS